MKAISIFNRKGGVGKTSITAALALFYGGLGKKVLCLDLDSQMNLSLFMSGFNTKEDVGYCFENSIVNVVYEDGFDINDAIYPAGEYLDDDEGNLALSTAFENVYFIPGAESIDNKNAEVMANALEFPQFKLRTAMKKLDDSWDIILQDNSPGENLLSVMSLIASESGGVLQPVTPDLNALVGLTMCKQIIDKVQNFAPGLRDLGSVLNNYKARESISQYTYSELENDPNAKFTGLTIRSASKIPVSILMKEGIVNMDRYLNHLPQTVNVAEDIVKLGEYILDAVGESR